MDIWAWDTHLYPILALSLRIRTNNLSSLPPHMDCPFFEIPDPTSRDCGASDQARSVHSKGGPQTLGPWAVWPASPTVINSQLHKFRTYQPLRQAFSRPGRRGSMNYPNHLQNPNDSSLILLIQRRLICLEHWWCLSMRASKYLSETCHSVTQYSTSGLFR